MKHRRDNNHSEIVKVFEDMYCSVFELDQVGDGLPDIIVGFDGINLLIEIKSAKGKLTKKQSEFWGTWRGQKIIVRSITDAVGLIHKHRSRQ